MDWGRMSQKRDSESGFEGKTAAAGNKDGRGLLE